MNGNLIKTDGEYHLEYYIRSVYDNRHVHDISLVNRSGFVDIFFNDCGFWINVNFEI